MITRRQGQICSSPARFPASGSPSRSISVEKRLAFASTVSVDEPSADRREAHDPLCGGCVYAHIAYPRQIALKAEIIGDAFVRIGKIPLADAVMVQPSPESGYGLRARLHVHGYDAGFYREGTHALCDARLTSKSARELWTASPPCSRRSVNHDSLSVHVEFSENIDGRRTRTHFDVVPDARALEPAFARAIEAARLTGCTARGQVGPLVRVGNPIVSDPLATLTHGRATSGRLGRQPASFFQGNRFLLPDLVGTVLDAAPVAGVLLDLYAGVGLFAVALASTGRREVIAVEGDKAASSDLQKNAEAYPDVLRVVAGRVEDFISRSANVPTRSLSIHREPASRAKPSMRLRRTSCARHLRVLRSADHGARRTPTPRRRLPAYVSTRASICSRTRRMWRVLGSSMSDVSFQFPVSSYSLSSAASRLARPQALFQPVLASCQFFLLCAGAPPPVPSSRLCSRRDRDDFPRVDFGRLRTRRTPDPAPRSQPPTSGCAPLRRTRRTAA